MSHSKRNTSRPVFTSHERALAKSAWTSSTARLHRESFLPFGSCNLCLEISREPVACQRGDIFCRECALANLIAQKKELKRAEKTKKRAEDERERKRAEEEGEEHERAVKDFERTQAGLEGTNGRVARKEESVKTKITKDEPASGDEMALVVGTKRKFALDEDELSRIAQEDRAKARKAIDDEKAAKPTLPSFWTPSLTPDVNSSKLKPTSAEAKTTPTCPASNDTNAHPLSMQKLIELHFDESTTDEGGTNERRRICPSCRKILSNSSNAIMAKPCGHVLCLKCVRQFLAPKGRPEGEPVACFTCDSPVSGKAPGTGEKDALPLGLVPLKSEGTGFSASGGSTIKKSSVAFQC
ncbi:RING finger domain-containing protein [Sarocladium strictum]